MLQLNNHDSDVRYMGLHDLSNELDAGNFKLDGDIERRLTTNVIKQLEDGSSDVRQQAVRWSQRQLNPMTPPVSAPLRVVWPSPNSKTSATNSPR
jgi:hypothetical protein